MQCVQLRSALTGAARHTYSDRRSSVFLTGGGLVVVALHMASDRSPLIHLGTWSAGCPVSWFALSTAGGAPCAAFGRRVYPVNGRHNEAQPQRLATVF